MPKQKHLSNPTRRSERIWCVRTYSTDIPWKLRRLGVPGFARGPRELWTKKRGVAEQIAQADLYVAAFRNVPRHLECARISSPNHCHFESAARIIFCAEAE